MIYAKVEGDEVIKIGSCPIVTNTTSNFHLMTDEEKALQGWFPVEDIKPVLNYGEYYDSPIYDIQVDKVVRTYSVLEQDLEVLRDNVKSKINQIADDKITTTYSPNVMIYALMDIPDANKKVTIKAFIESINTQRGTWIQSANDAVTKGDLETLLIEVNNYS